MKNSNPYFLGSLSLVLAVLLSGCGSENQRIQEIASLQSEAASKKAINEENKNIEAWAAQMEKDLQTRLHFYHAMAGTYSGEYQINGETFNTRLTFVPTLPVYQPDRIRRLEEITDDLTKLYLSAFVVEWDPETRSTLGCSFENLRPDLNSGETYLVSENCPKFYTIYLSERRESSDLSDPNPKIKPQVSPRMTEAVLAGQINKLDRLMIQAESENRPDVSILEMKRVAAEE